VRVRFAVQLAALVCAVLTIAAAVAAHDLERTAVTITFARDGSFVVDVANDLEWLKLRLPTFADRTPAGPKEGADSRRPESVDLAALSSMFIDRVVLFVDGHEVRPTSAEFVPPRPPPANGGLSAAADRQITPGNENPGAALHGVSSIDELPLGTYRLRGRMPLDAKTLRWYYGLVLDSYPLTVHRADGRTATEVVAGDAWSTTIDISGQFSLSRDYWLWVVVGLFAAALLARVVFGRRTQRKQRTQR
jgi:hypothetical protein